MENNIYTDKTLGMIYEKDKTIIRVWSPLKEEISLILYPNSKSFKKEVLLMTKGKDGVHEIILKGDYNGYFYTFLIDENKEVTDPYSIGSSMNSTRSAIIDLKDTNPKGWDNHSIPDINSKKDAIIYEVHIKDFTFSKASGVKERGKYLGFIEYNTDYKGFKTGLNHLKELGVTHIHLMPIYDFFTVDEDKKKFSRSDNYNWGYDPELYNVPEGSYATNPEDPITRIKELKTLIMTLHNEGFKVIIDVVYNHTYKSQDSNFNIIMPNYYHRLNPNGSFSNGSGTGNEISSEKPMARKFIIDSLLYWVKEYKVDGFRFDLMALIDIDTIELAIEELRRINPAILIYGESWTAASTPLPYDKLTLKGKQKKLSFGFFNDRFRDGIKGDNNGISKGFVGGNTDLKLDVESGITGSIDYDYLHIGFAKKPIESINYINSHDDLIVYDKFKNTFPHMAEEDIERLNRLAFSIIFCSQGIPFFHGGNEFLRTKYMIHNTYKSNIEINQIDWSLKEKNINFFNYFKDLIILRKTYDEFRINDVKEIKKRLKFYHYTKSENVIVYTIAKENNHLLIIHNSEFFSIDISKNNILEHLNTSYGLDKKNLRVTPIFTNEGLIKDKTSIDLKAENLEIPYFSTYIYDIK
ncbi:type I pullulanase [Clostridium sp. D2Q-11]|uniref:Type I pullulanase n=1 Tax=Anaeromonas frigoriresistens TaxID=2683708 RepID=A0A942USK3_9FIRM|nr:type I pullulanase [Anaeromonas frigoriresistens]MBS4538368.1 type I pullulanase [Anaeromonas frigoriresistens]